MKLTKIVCHSSSGSMLSLYVEHKCNNTVSEIKEKVISDEGDIAFLNKYEDGSYSYGIIQGDYKSMGHSKGYIWSSRPSVMNEIFGVHIYDVGVKLPGNEFYFSRAFDIDTLKSILPKDFAFVEDEFSDGEKYDRLAYVGTPIVYECGKRLYDAENDDINIVLNLNTILQDTL